MIGLIGFFSEYKISSFVFLVDSSKVYFPKEVSLCRSSLPGDVYGVYTKLVIPAGTWMGPFQGSPVLFNQLMVDSKIDMMWEVRE